MAYRALVIRGDVSILKDISKIICRYVNDNSFQKKEEKKDRKFL